MVLNKIFVLLPVMFAARKLDGEDPKTVFIIRCTYFSVQAIMALLVIYLYSQSRKVFNSKYKDVSIYIPSPPQPFSEKKAKLQYTKVKLGEHVMSIARSLLASTFFGFVLTTGLHFYKGIIIGLSMQTIMSPFNLFENVLTKAFLLNCRLKRFDLKEMKNIFGAKLREELTNHDEVVDEIGKLVAVDKSFDSGKDKMHQKCFEDILLDTWDEGSKADMKPFLDYVEKKNVNMKLSDSGWTPIMIIAAIGVKETVDVLEKLKKIGANPRIIDGEGWNALHWASFHSSVHGAKFLLCPSGFDGVAIGLHLAKDKEGKTPLDLANDENNFDVVKVIEDAIILRAKNKNPIDQCGLRQRK